MRRRGLGRLGPGKARTARLARQAALLSAQQETSLDGILVVDENGSIVSYNRRFVEMWGIPSEVIASRSDEAAIASVLERLADPEAFVRRVRWLYAHRRERSFDEIALSDGRVFERYSSPVYGPGDEYFGRVWYFRDITARLKAQEGLARSNADLETYAAASHDLNAPIRKITAFAELLGARVAGKLDESEREMLACIKRAASQMERLTRDVVELSRVARTPEPSEPVDLNDALAEVVAGMDFMIAEAKGTVSADGLPVVLAARGLMLRLLQNLVSNSLKFRHGARAPTVVFTARRAKGGVEVEVRDNGLGFDPSLAEEIFLPFRRLHPPGAYPGSGIGLSLCRRIVERYGGRIRAEGRPGEGAVFTIWFPDSSVAAFSG